MTLNGDVEGKPQLPSPIQRILIIHFNLYEQCMNGESLGEGASLEELSEPILYYHHDRHIDNGVAGRTDSNATSEYLMEEAVQFLGLCTALYTFPSSLTPSKTNEEVCSSNAFENHDKTKAIYFEKSTLLFIPLESSIDIVAVVQIARPSICEFTSNTGSGDPLAIQSSIERSHRLFCLLNGGGVLYRLNGSTLETSEKCRPYQGMDKLFGLLKQLRQAKQLILRCDDEEDKHEQLNAQAMALVDEIGSLRQGLTIQSIRRDLDAHYGVYLSDFSLVASRNGGAGRCLVEVPHVPIAQDSGAHILQVPPLLANPHSVMLLTNAIHETLRAHAPENVDTHRLDAVSLFHEGQLLHSETLPESHLRVSRECANLLMAYMASYQSKMNHVIANRECSHESPESTTSPAYQRGLRNLTRSIGSMAGALTKDNVSPQHTGDTLSQQPVNQQHRGRFLATPPSYMLSVSQQTHSIELGDNIPSIWAPLVNLPSGLPTSEETSDRSNCGVHMVMFRFLQFSFLVFLRLTSRPDSPLDTPRLFLMKLEEELSEAVLVAINDETVDESDAVASNDVTEWMNRPGQDVMFLDRDKHRIILMQDLTRSLSRHDMKMRKYIEKQPPRWFLGYGAKKKMEATVTKYTVTGSVMVEWSALGLDCRHLLASRLPLDVCLAFDDIINDMTARRREAGEKELTLEMCTCMLYGWVYAFGKGDKEIYVFFDNSIYVTVADVQAAAKSIRHSFLEV